MSIRNEVLPFIAIGAIASACVGLGLNAFLPGDRVRAGETVIARIKSLEIEELQ